MVSLFAKPCTVLMLFLTTLSHTSLDWDIVLKFSKREDGFSTHSWHCSIFLRRRREANHDLLVYSFRKSVHPMELQQFFELQRARGMALSSILFGIPRLRDRHDAYFARFEFWGEARKEFS
jgi:hypothetical protein